MFLQGINTIGDVLDALSVDLGIQRQFLSIVDTTTGQILNEEDLIKHLHIKCIELMIGNENRNNGFTGKDGGIVETDVIDNKKLTSGKCQMSCGHFIGYYLLIHIFRNAKVYMLIHRINCNLIGYLSYILFLYCFLLKYSVSIL